MGFFATASIYGVDYSKDITERRIAGSSEMSQVKEHNLGSGLFIFLTCVFGVSAVGTGAYGANQLGKSIDHAKGRRDEDLGMHVQDTHNLVYYDKR